MDRLNEIWIAPTRKIIELRSVGMHWRVPVTGLLFDSGHKGQSYKTACSTMSSMHSYSGFGEGFRLVCSADDTLAAVFSLLSHDPTCIRRIPGNPLPPLVFPRLFLCSTFMPSR